MCFWWNHTFIQLFDQYTSFRGIEPSSSAVDIKKAYRKAALRHHPDKVSYYFFSLLWLSLLSCLTVVLPQASKFLVRSENISDAVWRDITNEIRRDADYLFKIIGKAYAMLSDPTTVCITEIYFIFFLCSCYWCCIFYFLFTRTFMSNEWALFWIRFILPDAVMLLITMGHIEIISQM